MRYVIDLDSLELIESATDRRRVTQVEGKRGDDSPFEVVFVRSGVAEELAGSTVLTFGAKEENKYDAAAVVLEDGFTLSGAGITAVYSANPSFNTAALNALFLIDADDTNDPPYKDLMAEFSWQVGAGAPTSTKTFRFRVHNDVIRDDEVSPTPAYSPIGATAPVNEVAATVTINPAGADNSVLYTADTAGADGNDITIAYIISGAGSAVISVDVTATAIAVTAGSATTAASVITAVNGDVDAAALVLAAASGPDTGVIAAVAATNLTGGVTATAAPPYVRTAGGFLYIQEAGVWKKTALSAL